MENFDQNYLQHHGTKGQRWGVRRYQNKDGSLTPAGRKRYAKESERLKAEEQKLKAEQKVLANKKKTQAKFDKLDAKKADLEAKKKALKEEEAALKKGKKTDNAEVDKRKETVEEKRAKLLKSTDANELYKNKDLLTTAEIEERLNRINTEKRLEAVAASTKTTGMQKIEKAIDTFKKVDKAYSAVSDSSVGKSIKKKLGLDDKNDGGFDLDKAYKNLYSMSDEQAKKAASRVENNEKIRKAWEQVHGKADKNQNQNQNKGKNDSDDQNQTNNSTKNKDSKTKTYEGTVEGEGTSRRSDTSNTSSKKPDDYYDPIDAYGEWVNDSASNRSSGQRYVAGLLDTALNSEAARAGRLLLEEAIK